LTLGVSSIPSNAVTTNQTGTGAFIADCAYTYTIQNIPVSTEVFHMTMPGDFSSITFDGIDLATGIYFPVTPSTRTLPTIIARMRIGIQ
jgi:hypothetical protein